jgi:hypothetical protein
MFLSRQDSCSAVFCLPTTYALADKGRHTSKQTRKTAAAVFGETRTCAGLCRFLGNAMISKCECCSKEFEHDKPRRFCSASCRGRHNAARQQRRGETISCPVCGKQFYIQPAYVKRGMKYCSTKCKYKDMSGEKHPQWKGGLKLQRTPRKAKEILPVKKCPACQKEFAPKRREQIYCSKACHNRPTREDRTCEICGKVFTAKPAEIKEGHGRFCSRQCFGAWCSAVRVGEDHPSWKGGGSEYYGSNWQTQRRAARRRDGNTCQRCGVTSEQTGKSMDVHHIKRFRSFESSKEANQLSNLVCLCHTCHSIVECYGIDFELTQAVQP